jgi:hypothetical protein
MRWRVDLTCNGLLHALVRRSVAASEPSEPLRHDGTDHLPTRGIAYGVGTFEGVQTTLSGGVIRPPSTEAAADASGSSSGIAGGRPPPSAAQFEAAQRTIDGGGGPTPTAEPAAAVASGSSEVAARTFEMLMAAGRTNAAGKQPVVTATTPLSTKAPYAAPPSAARPSAARPSAVLVSASAAPPSAAPPSAARPSAVRPSAALVSASTVSSAFTPGRPLTVWWPVPVLPEDTLRMIWGNVWVSHAACIIQHAVRAAIARAAGDPWDLPGLSPVHVTYDECCAPTHTRTHHHITVDVITSSPCRWGVWSHHQRDRLLWSETAWQAYN